MNIPQFCISRWTKVAAATLGLSLIVACSNDTESNTISPDVSPYLFVFAGDQDTKESDFLMVIDVDPTSKTRGKPITSLPIGHKMSMPHHTEYVVPPNGEPIFMNAHHHELSLIVDVSNPRKIEIKNQFMPPAPYRFPHDYTRTPSGTRLVGFLRSNGNSPYPTEKVSPGNHGGIAEYSVTGDLIRTVSAAAPGLEYPVRPYAFALLPELDRFVVTSAPMMEHTWADVVQIYRYSDFKLLHTISLPAGQLANGKVLDGSQAAGFGPRVLDDGTVFLNSYGCAFYHLSDINTESPKLKTVYTLKTNPTNSRKNMRDACGIPVQTGQFWIQPVAKLNAVVVLDISNPETPKEVSRLRTPKDFKPHWLAKDDLGNRLVLGAELEEEQGFFILNFDNQTGALSFDKTFQAKNGNGIFRKKLDGYISLKNQQWPHGDTGDAWGHAALFLTDKTSRD